MHENSEPANKSGGGFWIIVVILAIWFFWGDSEQERELDVSVELYWLARSHGTASEMCERAADVAENYKRANDSAGFLSWKAIEKEDCSKVGDR